MHCLLFLDNVDRERNSFSISPFQQPCICPSSFVNYTRLSLSHKISAVYEPAIVTEMMCFPEMRGVLLLDERFEE
jgi:hypothetical protein